MSKSLKKLIDINRLREFKNKLVGADSTFVQTAAVDQTIAGTKTFSKPIVGSVTGSSGSCTGNAASATKATQDAAGNTITTTYATKAENNTKANNSEVVHKSGDETIAGTKTFNGYVHANGFHSTAVNGFMAQRGGYTLILRNDGNATYLLMSDKDGVPGTWSDARPLVISNSTGVCDINGNASTATTATTAQACTGNAATATKLATARTIALSGAATGTATGFDGSGNITIPVTALDASKLTGTASVSTTGNAATATKATNADHATNADSATKAALISSNSDDYHVIRFDWSRQVSGFVGIRIDTTDVGGIVTTNNIRAQWYAAYPDGAEAHNAMWGGRDITAAFNAGTVSTNISNGTFKDIFPGDYITKTVTIGGTAYTVNWVIADCDYWINKGDPAMTAHHVAIVPQVPIFSARMNSTSTTEGSYKGSEMYKNIIPACATGIVNAFGSSHILTFRDAISNSVDTSHASSGIPQLVGTPGWWGEWVSVQCNLMSEKMVYGAPICSGGAMNNVMATRQMSAFRLSERLINYGRHTWWLRDVVSVSSFARVYGSGFAGAGGASDTIGVRPFALLV